MEPKRPILRYHGGKWLLAPWIIENLPEHRCYCEPFGGAASVLLRKPRSYAEVYNDLDGEVVNLFKVVRDRGQELKTALHYTPFARLEYLEAWHPSADPLEQARRTVVRAFMGFASASVTLGRLAPGKARGGLEATGFRANSKRTGNIAAADWANYADALDDIIDRLRGVVIENRDAFKLIKEHDSPDTLFYVDPPYLPETRDKGNDYKHELTQEQHEKLAADLHTVKGMVVLSGYDSELYNRLYQVDKWVRCTQAARADGLGKRTEILYLSSNVQRQPRLDL